MTNQGVLESLVASSPPAEPLAGPRDDAVTPFPRPPTLNDEASGGPLAQRIARAMGSSRRAASRIAPYVIPSEFVTALVVTLPKTSARQRAALLTFAVEDHIAAPIDSVVVEPARLGSPATSSNTHLALVVSRGVLATAVAAAPSGAPILPDFLALRRPEAPPDAPVWAVWREGARVVVRRSDGTGFAAATDALPVLWLRAGRPTLISLGAALPSNLPATDLSHAPPEPDPLDLSFSFRRNGSEAGLAARPLVAAGAILLMTLVVHLGLAGADALALGRISAAERAAAEVALASILPDVKLDDDPAAILARLAPATPAERRSDFLPLLAQASAAIAETGRPVTFRRLSWGAEDGALSLLVQGTALPDLQVVEQALRDLGLDVTVGASNAGDGGAEVEMRLSRSAG